MAKAKRLNTTVHLTDPETGEARILGPNDKLDASVRKELEKNWGKRAGEFLEETEDEEPEEVSQVDHEAAGRPLADSAPADGSPQLKEAQGLRVDAREDANAQGNADAQKTGQGGRASTGKVAGQK